MTTHQVTEEIPVQEQSIELISIEMPFGLLGFESVKEYLLVSDPEEQPFMWFQMKNAGEEAQSFLVISPFVIHPGYSPEFADEEMESIGIQSADDALIFNVVTIHEEGNASVNLKGPIVISRTQFKGKQIVPINAADFRVDHPLETEPPTF